MNFDFITGSYLLSRINQNFSNPCENIGKLCKIFKIKAHIIDFETENAIFISFSVLI